MALPKPHADLWLRSAPRSDGAFQANGAVPAVGHGPQHSMDSIVLRQCVWLWVLVFCGTIKQRICLRRQRSARRIRDLRHRMIELETRVSCGPQQKAEELFETTAQCLLSGVDRDALSGWGAIIYVVCVPASQNFRRGWLFLSLSLLGTFAGLAPDIGCEASVFCCYDAASIPSHSFLGCQPCVGLNGCNAGFVFFGASSSCRAASDFIPAASR